MATNKKEKAQRTKFAKLVAGLKDSISKKQTELDAAGLQRKALSPEIVDELREGVTAIFPDADEEMLLAVMQMIVDVLSEELPDSEEPDDRPADDEQSEHEDDEDDEEEKKQVAALTEQITEMGKEYNLLIKDVSEVVQLTHKAFDQLSAQNKSYDGLASDMAAMKKKLGERPRRASQATETELDPESKLAKDLKNQQQDLSDVPEAFKDMYGPPQEGAQNNA
jgi:HSP90 family molecular chaperone